MDPVGQISPDGKWWWNGKQWVSAASADGRWQWDGRNWVATSPVGSSRHEPSAAEAFPLGRFLLSIADVERGLFHQLSTN